MNRLNKISINKAKKTIVRYIDGSKKVNVNEI